MTNRVYCVGGPHEGLHDMFGTPFWVDIPSVRQTGEAMEWDNRPPPFRFTLHRYERTDEVRHGARVYRYVKAI